MSAEQLALDLPDGRTLDVRVSGPTDGGRHRRAPRDAVERAPVRARTPRPRPLAVSGSSRTRAPGTPRRRARPAGRSPTARPTWPRSPTRSAPNASTTGSPAAGRTRWPAQRSCPSGCSLAQSPPESRRSTPTGSTGRPGWRRRTSRRRGSRWRARWSSCRTSSGWRPASATSRRPAGERAGRPHLAGRRGDARRRVRRPRQGDARGIRQHGSRGLGRRRRRALPRLGIRPRRASACP